MSHILQMFNIHVIATISNTFLFLFSNKMAEIHKKLVRVTKREDPHQTASSEAV